MKRKVISLLVTTAICISLIGCGDKKVSNDGNTSKTDTDVVTDQQDLESNDLESNTGDVNEDGTLNNPEAVKAGDNELIFWSLFSGGDGDYMDQIIEDYNATNPSKKVISV